MGDFRVIIDNNISLNLKNSEHLNLFLNKFMNANPDSFEHLLKYTITHLSLTKKSVQEHSSLQAELIQSLMWFISDTNKKNKQITRITADHTLKLIKKVIPNVKYLSTSENECIELIEKRVKK